MIPAGQVAPSFTEALSYRAGRVGQVAVTGSATTPFTETFVYRPDGSPLELLRQVAGTPGVRHYACLLDGQGDVVGLADATGAVVARYGYDTWGRPLPGGAGADESGGVHQPLRYRGYWYDGWDDSTGVSADQGWNAGPLPWYWLTARLRPAPQAVPAAGPVGAGRGAVVRVRARRSGGPGRPQWASGRALSW